MPDNETCYLDLLEASRRIQAGEITSVELTRAMLQRIEAIDPRLHSYATVMRDQALAAAERCDDESRRGKRRSALHGVPVAVKDLLWTTDAPTSHGMPLHRAFVATEDATTVRRLRDAGAVILGKLQMTEGAYGAHHPDVPTPVNPWGGALWPGVSSSGPGVATAAGLCYASLGTDTGGSIRYPSAANGVTGLKPTWGRVSRHGAFALAASLDHIGPMARTAADAAAMLQVIAGPDVLDPTCSQERVPDYLAAMSLGLDGLTVGVDAKWSLDGADAPTRAALMQAIAVIENAGGRVREVQVPGSDDLVRSWTPLCAVETAIEHEDTYPARREAYGAVLAGLIDAGRDVNAMDHQKREAQRQQLRGRMNRLFAEVDLLLAPVTPDSGLTSAQIDAALAEEALRIPLQRYTTPFNLTGHPGITLPGGRTPGGSPVGLQFIGRHFGEDLLVRAGWAYQQATSWHREHPPL